MIRKSKLAYRLIWGAILGLLIVIIGVRAVVQASEITEKGYYLADEIEQMNVEHHWLPETPIDWKTGEQSPDERSISSHCSAFVAAICYKKNIYILRPPEHSQLLLANAQCAWLEQHGAKFGWMVVSNPMEAQKLANNGVLVVVCYKSPNSHRPGHIALIRPSEKSCESLFAEGPQIAQAGAKNYNSVSLRTGFEHHPGAWITAAEYKVKFYRHE